MNSREYWRRVQLEGYLKDGPEPSDAEGLQLARLFELEDVLTKGPLEAITLHQPWAWAIFTLGKDVENRHWAYPATLNGAWVAIHAGKTYDTIGAEWLQRAYPEIDIPPASRLAMGAIVGLVRLGGCLEYSSSRWYAGWPYKAWLLEEPYRLNPAIACRGYKKFWTVEEQVRQMIYQDWRQPRFAQGGQENEV